MSAHLHLLLIDDDSVDVTTLRRAVQRSGASISLDHVRDGVEALARLRNTEARKPQLIILDLRMPRMDGLEFLAAKAQDRELATIPSVVLTTSRDARDRDACYRLGAAGFIAKPSESRAHVLVIRRIYEYWTLCETPRPPEQPAHASDGLEGSIDPG